jgi:hypothetical protein
MKTILRCLLFSLPVLVLTNCKKDCDGCSDAVGGELPTNYIIIKENSFSPTSVSAVNGSTFTFVNQSATSKGVLSLDSFLINQPNVAPNKSFVFKKDTVGTIYFELTGKPGVYGTIIQTP